MTLERAFLSACQRNNEKFWARVSCGDPEKCWPWTGANDGRKGYGRFKIQSDWGVGTHRVAYALAYGLIPRGLDVLHRCDNPPCCNPAHLFIGSHKDNMADMALKGRANGVGRPGEANANAKLTQANVTEIRGLIQAGHRNTEIAARYGVGDDIISKIKTGKAWVTPNQSYHLPE